MKKKTPGIVLCVKCYVTMLRDKKDVTTITGGTIKWHAPTEVSHKAKLAQMVKGQGVKALTLYHEHANEIDNSSPRHETILTTLRELPSEFYVPGGGSSSGNGGGAAENMDVLLARLAKLELDAEKQSPHRERAASAAKAQAPEKKHPNADDPMRRKMIEEYFGILRREGGTPVDDLERELTLFSAMDARKI